MSLFKDRPIKSKLTIIIMLSTFLSLSALSSVFVYQRYHAFKQQMTDEFTSITKIIADRSNAAILFEDSRALTETLSSLSLHQYVLIACTYNEEGTLLAFFHRPKQALKCPTKPKPEKLLFSDKSFYISEPILVDKQTSGRVFIEASTIKLDKEIRTTIYNLLGLSSFIILVAFLFSAYIQRFISDPLTQLKNAAKKVSIDQHQFPKLVKQNDDEIGSLVDAFNKMFHTIAEQKKVIIEHTANLEKKVTERTKELEISNKELEAFSYSVSHDLKAPLRIIEGFSRALEEDYGEELDDTAQDYLSRVRIGSYKMSLLITNLLQLSKVTRQELNKDVLDLSKLCEKSANNINEQHPERSANIDIQENMQAMGDTNLIEILLDNLIGNAWKYSLKETGTHIEIGQEIGTGHPIYYVKDNGCGFNMKYAQKLFKPFNRLHSPEEFEGSGIGLATVARIIERHHGKIWAKSEPESGACFYFTLFPPSSNNEAATDNSQEKRKNTVL
jgi:signal transduction histidine kinase